MWNNADAIWFGWIWAWLNTTTKTRRLCLRCVLTSAPVSVFQFMQWSQQHTQTSSLCPSLVSLGSLPSAQQLRWLWFHSWAALPKRPRLPRSALWRAWRPPRVALRWGAMRARARHPMLRASHRCHRTRYASLLSTAVFALLCLLPSVYTRYLIVWWRSSSWC